MPFDGKLPATPGGIADQLMQAKQYLIDNGWCHENWSGINPNGGVCVGIAMSRVYAGGLTIRCLLNAIGVDDMGDVPMWNDHPDRTFDEVMDAFDRAIAIALTKETVNAV